MPPAKLTVVITACVLLALAVPTAAVGVGEDHATEDVTLEPTSTHASIDDGELRLDLEALNGQAATQVDDVFAVGVNLDTVDRIWVENDVDGVSFYDSDDRTTITDSSPLEFDDGATASIGVSIDTRVAPEGAETFTIVVGYEGDGVGDGDEDDEGSAPGGGNGAVGIPVGDDTGKTDEGQPAAIEQTDLEASPTTLEPGETVTVNATYENVGNKSGEHTVEFVADGTLVETESIELAPDESETVDFEWTPDEPGTYELAVDGVSAGSIEVQGSTVFPIENRELPASVTAALAPPTAIGLFLAITNVRRRWL
ncbi:CARDB domain-containing protein [Natrarchaeobius sp. A-rgal3]|uniref:CARDB domain-containing protein n=1 Tax=Natrarchaeobius versutus TaxID=1679078 RepID=UPI00350F6178